MRLTLFAYSRAGCQTVRKILAARREDSAVCYAAARLEEDGFLPLEKAVYRQAFSSSDALIFVGACGIAVREIAPYVRDKRTDPAVVCIDERARFAISLLSGHIGGANALTAELAEALGATPVITTATDVNGRFSVDAWAAQNGFRLDDMRLAKAVSAAILERDVPFCCEAAVTGPLPSGLFRSDAGRLGIYIGCRRENPFEDTLHLVPQVLRVGIGCRRGTPKEAIETAIQTVFAENGLFPEAISGVYSIDLKKDEPGLLAACREHGWPVRFYSASELLAVPGEFSASQFVRSVTGVENVCERAALLGAERLLVKKTALNGVTVAAAQEHWEVDFGKRDRSGHRPGQL